MEQRTPDNYEHEEVSRSSLLSLRRSFCLVCYSKCEAVVQIVDRSWAEYNRCGLELRTILIEGGQSDLACLNLPGTAELSEVCSIDVYESLFWFPTCVNRFQLNAFVGACRLSAIVGTSISMQISTLSSCHSQLKWRWFFTVIKPPLPACRQISIPKCHRWCQV